MSKDQPEKQLPARADWEAIERDYRTGMYSLSELGRLHGVTKGRISQVAKKNAWVQDLSGKIKAKAAQKVNDAAVNAELNTQRKISDAEKVEVGATVMARVLIEHKSSIGRSRNLTIKLLDELEHQTDNMDLLRQLGEIMFSPDDKGKDRLNEVYHTIISLPERTKTMKALGETLKVLIGLEREAFGITAQEQAADPLAQLFQQVSRSALPIAKTVPADDGDD